MDDVYLIFLQLTFFQWKNPVTSVFFIVEIWYFDMGMTSVKTLLRLYWRSKVKHDDVIYDLWKFWVLYLIFYWSILIIFIHIDNYLDKFCLHLNHTNSSKRLLSVENFSRNLSSLSTILALNYITIYCTSLFEIYFIFFQQIIVFFINSSKKKNEQ